MIGKRKVWTTLLMSFVILLSAALPAFGEPAAGGKARPGSATEAGFEDVVGGTPDGLVKPGDEGGAPKDVGTPDLVGMPTNENGMPGDASMPDGGGRGEGTQSVLGAIGTHLVFGDTRDEQLKRLTVKGTSKIATVSAQVGALKDDYRVRTLEGKGSELSFQLSGITPGKPLTLEFEEIHTRNGSTLYYSVFVNGRETYVRTYEEASDGPNHYFVQVPAAAVGNRSIVNVKLHNDGGAKVNFGRVWAYSDFESLLASERVGGKMTVGLFQPVLSYTDYAADLAVLNKLKADYSNFSMYQPSVAFDIYYMHWNEEKVRSRLDYLMRLSHDSGLPIHLSINSWWSGTPGGPDGKGGKWGDIPYNQVVYDPLNIDGKGNWKLSTPNIWGNTPWLTMNNADYNKVRADKVKAIAQYISGKTAQMQLEGAPVPPVVIFTENEPLYWPYFAFNASPDAGADFSPLVIAAAAKDGVMLNPEDGLSAAEQDWLSDNLTAYIGELSKSIADGYGYNEIIVDQGTFTEPDTQLVENAYTHMFVIPNYPNWDEKKAAWETHMVPDIRYGAEWAGDMDTRYLDYIIARGRYADVNAERSSITDMKTLEKAYVSGANYVNIYNFRDGDQRLIQAVDNKQSEPVPTPSYDRSFVSYDFKDEHALDLNEVLVEAGHVKRDALNGDHIVTADNGDAGGGELTFKLDGHGTPFASGAKVQVQGRALSDLNAACRVEVWAGPSPDRLTLTKTLRNFSSENVDISGAIDKSSDVAYVRLMLFSTGLPSSVYSWTAVWKLKAYALWDQASGHVDGFRYTEEQTRDRNRWIGYRADVERLLQDYAERSGEDATYADILKQYRADKYVTAYGMLTRALSETLPAKFAVKGNGQLGRYPIKLGLADPSGIVNATLYEFGRTVKINLAAQTAATVTVTVSKLVPSYYKAVDQGGGNYAIVRAAAADPAAVSAVGGRAVFTLNAAGAGETAKRYPHHFEASYVSIDNDARQPAPPGYIYIQSQDPEVGEYVNSVAVKLADDVVVIRGADGAPDDRLEPVPIAMLGYGEKLDITMNNRNEAVKIKAYYGRIAGKITAIEPISIRGQLRDASIRIDGGETLEIGSEAVFDSPKATGTNIFSARVDDLGFRPGDVVTVLYSPYTYNGSSKRVLKISETYDTLLSETFEEAGGDWRSRVYSATNVRVAPLDTNYHNKVVRPDNITATGELVWKVDSAEPLTDLSIEYSGRAIMGSGQSVKWYVSGNDADWIEVGGISQTDGNDGNFTFARSIALHDEIAGLTTVYIKCVLKSSTDDTWASLNDMKLRKKASARELASADISLGGGESLFAGQTVPLLLNARYDNGDPVSVNDAKVFYEIGDSSIATVANGSMKLLRSGTTTIQADLSVGGRVIKSNVLPVTVEASTIADVKLSISDETIGAGETAVVTATVYNDRNALIDPSQYAVAYVSSDSRVASVSAIGSVTGVAPGAATITAKVSQGGQLLEKSLTVNVARVRTVYESDFSSAAVCPDNETCNSLAGNEAYKVPTDSVLVVSDKAMYANVEVAAGVFAPAIRGYYKGQGGPDGTWPIKERAAVVYKLESLGDAFLRLRADVNVRVGVMGSKVSVYVGDDADHVDTLVQELAEGGVHPIDLTAYAAGRKSVYVKLVIGETAFDWGGIVSVRFDELTKS